MDVTYDISEPGFLFNAAGTPTTPANRVVDITIAGVPYLRDGAWLVDPVSTTVDLATLAFLCTGGDQYFRTEIGGSERVAGIHRVHGRWKHKF
jgi:hypothetical protein